MSGEMNRHLVNNPYHAEWRQTKTGEDDGLAIAAVAFELRTANLIAAAGLLQKAGLSNDPTMAYLEKQIEERLGLK